MAQCAPYLLRQVELIQPKLILAMGRFAGADAARHRREHREPARPAAPLSGRAAHRHLSSGLPAAQPARQGQGLGRSVLRAAHRSRACNRGTALPQLTRAHVHTGGTHAQISGSIRSRLTTAGLSGCGYNDIQRTRRTGQGRLVRSAQPVPAARRPDAEPGQHGERVRGAGAAGADAGDRGALARRQHPGDARADQRSGGVPALPGGAGRA